MDMVAGYGLGLVCEPEGDLTCTSAENIVGTVDILCFERDFSVLRCRIGAMELQLIG
jgi:hypothetical protein